MISIYKITSPLYSNTIYIGSTKKTIKHRFSRHKTRYKRWLNKKASADYCYSYPLLKYGTIKLLETCDEKDGKMRELIYIIIAKTIMKCVNKNYPLCTSIYRKKRFRQSDKGKLYIKLYHKLYRKKYKQTDKYKLSQKNYASKKVACSICNSIVSQGAFSRHQKSKKCKSFISKQL